mmetsp:Transcript_22898/g.61438  ORF Transcript_22898/g.61438 Transcript_22898/m.61438 type:complete len:233 (+) Transcript_22898:178-876(+)
MRTGRAIEKRPRRRREGAITGANVHAPIIPRSSSLGVLDGVLEQRVVLRVIAEEDGLARRAAQPREDGAEVAKRDALVGLEHEARADAPRLADDHIHGGKDEDGGDDGDLGLHQHPRGREEAAEGGEHADGEGAEDEGALRVHLVHRIVHRAVLSPERLAAAPHGDERDHGDADEVDADRAGHEEVEHRLCPALVGRQVDLDETREREASHDGRLGAHGGEVGIEEVELLLA